MLDDSLDRGDGVQQYVLTLGDWLSKNGHKVHYLVGQTKRHDLPNVHSLSRNISVRFNGNRMSMPRPAPKEPIAKLLYKEQFDVLHVQMPYSPWLAGRIINATPEQTALVGTFHILPYGGVQYRAAQLLSWWSRRSTARLAKIWSVSEPAREFAEQLGISSTVLPNMVDLSRFKKAKLLKTSDSHFKMVFLGRLVERKGCAELLQALRVLTTTTHDVHLTICGDGPDRAALESYVAEHHLKDHVTFTGYIAEGAKAGYLAAADLAVFPSLGGESFGIVLIEAMAAGAGVVVGGNNPGYASVLGSLPRCLVNAHDTVSFARQLKRLHDDPKLRQQLHKDQQALVKQYDASVVGQKLVSYYQDISASTKG